MHAILSLVCVLLALGSQAAAAQAEERLYLGAGIGISDLDRGMASGLIDSGTVDGKDSGMQILGGYRFGRYGAFELAHVDLGQLEYSGTFQGLPVSDGRIKVSGWSAAALGLYPVREQLEVFAKGGLYVWKMRERDVTFGTPTGAKHEGVDLFFGFGASYFLRRNAGVRVAWEHFELGVNGANLFSTSVFMTF